MAQRNFLDAAVCNSFAHFQWLLIPARVNLLIKSSLSEMSSQICKSSLNPHESTSSKSTFCPDTGSKFELKIGSKYNSAI
jgi:hypothetical protein